MGLGLEAKRVVGAGEVGVRGTLKPSPGGNTVRRSHIYLGTESKVQNHFLLTVALRKATIP